MVAAQLPRVVEAAVALVAVVLLLPAVPVVAVAVAAAAATSNLSFFEIRRLILPALTLNTRRWALTPPAGFFCSGNRNKAGVRQVLSFCVHPRATQIDRAGPRGRRNRIGEKCVQTAKSGHFRFRQA